MGKALCYLDPQLSETGVLGMQLTEKKTGRLVEIEVPVVMRREREHFLAFLRHASMLGSKAMPNLFSPTEMADAIMVSGSTARDACGFVVFRYDGALSYLLV